jgi:hypothetical protein
LSQRAVHTRKVTIALLVQAKMTSLLGFDCLSGQVFIIDRKEQWYRYYSITLIFRRKRSVCSAAGNSKKCGDCEWKEAKLLFYIIEGMANVGSYCCR